MAIKHAIYYMLGRGVPSIVAFLSVLIYTRLLSPAEYGNYALIMTFINLVNSVVFQWLRIGLLRFMPDVGEQQEVSFKSTLVVGFIINGACTFLISLGSGIMLHNNIVLSTIIAVNVILFAWFEMNQSLFRTILEPVAYGVLTFQKALFSLVISVALIYIGQREQGLLLGGMLGTLLSLVGVTISRWKDINLKKYSVIYLRELLKYGFPLTVTFALMFVIQFSDRIIIGWLKGAEAAGLYAVATDLSNQTLNMVMMVINLGALPLAITKYQTEGEESARNQLKVNYFLMVGFSMPVLITGTFLSVNIASLLFKGEFQISIGELLPYLLIGTFFLGLKSFYFDQSFQIGKKTLLQIIPVAVGAVFCIVLNWILIPGFGLQGAAISSIVSYLISMLLSWYFGSRAFRLSVPVKDTFKIFLAAAISALCLIPLMNSKGILMFIVAVIIELVVYGLFLWLLDVAKLRGYLNGIYVKRLKKVREGYSNIH